MKSSSLDGIDTEFTVGDWMNGDPIEDAVVDSNWRRNMSSLDASVELVEALAPSHEFKSDSSKRGPGPTNGDKWVESTRGLP